MINRIGTYLSIFYLFSSAAGIDTLKIDLEESQIKWTGRKVSGEHFGTLNLSDGFVVIKDEKLIEGKFIFDMSTIKNTDIETEKWNNKLVNHLKSEDFFNVDSFPHVIFQFDDSVKITNLTDGEIENSIKGNLTIRGITHPHEIQFTISKSANDYFAAGSININRVIYGIRYGSGQFFKDLGDKMIDDEFTIDFQLKTVIKNSKP